LTVDAADVAGDIDTAREIEAMRAALPRLTPRERCVIELRYLRKDHTLPEVAAALGITRQRAHKLESVALAKLREFMAESA
jgi:RNA polymerase sigma factor (sigma-70 family)